MESMTYQTDAKPEEPWRPAIARRRAPVNGWVYFLLGEDTGRYKIGRAKDVEKRLKELRTGASEQVDIYGVIPAKDPVAMERALHRRFAKYRIHGEWFDGTGIREITDFVDMYGYEIGGTHRIWEECYPDDLPTPRLPPAYRL